MSVRSNSGKVVHASKSQKVEDRRKAAQERQTLRDERTPQEQLRLLEARGHGHCQEAQHLRELVLGALS